MYALAEFIHYGTIALTVGINSIGSGIGEGLTSIAALDAINRQPSAKGDIVRLAILGMALIETAAIMGAVISSILLFGDKTAIYNMYAGIAELGIALAICISGFVLGITSSYPAIGGCYAVARQPFFAEKILRFVLITQSLIQSPIIFGFIISLVIKYQTVYITTLTQSLRLIAGGISIGIGSIGPSIGLAIFAYEACKAISVNPTMYNKLFSFTLVTQTIIETPIIFSFVVSMYILFIVPENDLSNMQGIALLAAGLCTGLGTLGTGISSGKTAAAACSQIALHPQEYNPISRTSMFAQGLIETSAIYAILVSLLLTFAR